MPIPFAPANPLCLPTRPSKETIQKVKNEVWNTALECAFNKLGLLLFQQLVGNTFTGDILAQELQDSWDTLGHPSFYPYTRVDLSPLKETDILDGEDVVKPMCFNKTTMKEEPMKISVGYIMERGWIVVRVRHTMNKMLQDMGIGGFHVCIFRAFRDHGKPGLERCSYDINLVRVVKDDPVLRAKVEGGVFTMITKSRIRELEKRYSSAIHRNEHYEAESVLDTLNRFKSQLPGLNLESLMKKGCVSTWD